MSSPSFAAEPESHPEPIVDDAARHWRVLDGMIEAGAALIQLLHEQAVAQAAAGAGAVVDVAVAYERISRAVRRSMLLVQRLGEEAPAGQARVAARRRVIRVVEDMIQRETDGAEADGLRTELAERLDGPELEEEIGDRPVAEIITDICRDLGLGRPMPGIEPWARRTPADVAALCALAEAPAGRGRGLPRDAPAARRVVPPPPAARARGGGAHS